MKVLYVVVTIVAALMNGGAAVMSLAGAPSVTAVADRLHLPHWLMRPLGGVLAVGTTGLLVGLAVPPIGVAAAGGLVLYFACALATHLRADDHDLAGALFYLAVALAALGVQGARRSPWWGT